MALLLMPQKNRIFADNPWTIKYRTTVDDPRKTKYEIFYGRFAVNP
jgi:hypothetical protein